MNEAIQRLHTAILIQIINDDDLAKAMGLRSYTVKELAKLNVLELQELSKTNCIVHHCDKEQLHYFAQRIRQKQDCDDYINKAILLGASRAMMKKLIDLSYVKFDVRRKKLNLKDIRKRPKMLTVDEDGQLEILYKEYKQQYQLISRIDYLQCLIYLSEQTQININRIYKYFNFDNRIFYS